MKKWSESGKNGPILWSSGRSGFTGFRGRDPKPTRRHQVFKVKTQVQLPEQSNQVVPGRVQAGGGLIWTALTGGSIHRLSLLHDSILFGYVS